MKNWNREGRLWYRKMGIGQSGRSLNQNERNDEIISSPDSQVIVRVMKTNEELIIARHTARLAFS